MLLTSIADAEAISRLLAPGVTMIWLLDVSVTLVMGGGISFGAPIQFNKLENTIQKFIYSLTEKSWRFVKICIQHIIQHRCGEGIISFEG